MKRRSRLLVVTSSIALFTVGVTGCSGGGDDDDGGDGSGCPPTDELLQHVTAVVDTNGDPNDLESVTFVDRNQDGLFDAADGFDLDRDGQPDDFDGDGRPDNRFYFDDRSEWIPDADSFDDFEAPENGIPRGVTPVSADCPADGVATGPVDLGYETWKPSQCCRRR